MKITFGRKFLGCTIATVIDVAIFVSALIVAPAAITGPTVVAFGAFIITIWFAYIGGNVWTKYIASKGK